MEKSSDKLKEKKGIIIKFVLIIISFIFLWWLFSTYAKIDVSTINDENTLNYERTSLETNEISSDDETDISSVLEKCNKSVVGISKIQDIGTSIFQDGSTKNLGIGTGFIVSENGYIVTNTHVSGEKYSYCYVTLENGKTYNGSVVWSDSSLDLSIIKINMKNLDYINIGDSNSIKIGESVYAIGNPVGFEFQRTVTSGIISAINRTIKFTEDDTDIYMADLIQTDASINSGNSGGPLINKSGNVIGVNSVKLTSADGIGFAVPINVIKPIIDKFIKDGSFDEASIGIFAYDKNVIPYLNKNINFESGIYVAEVEKNSVAMNADIKEGDIITKIDGIELNKMNDLKEYIYSKSPNDEVTLTIQRNKEIKEIKLNLGKK